MFFCDIDETGSRFCAETFVGEMVQTSPDFAALRLPADIDIIWLGSIFTHLSYANVGILFDRLFGPLTPGGALIITYRGRRMYELMRTQHPRQVEKWMPLLMN
jgi:hypothetical protein